MNWRTFLLRLEREVDWNRHADADVRVLEDIVTEFGQHREAVAAAIAALAQDHARLETCVPHMEYPRPFMDKFVMHLDANERFRVRVHRFRAGSPRGLGPTAPTIHDHRWNFTTFVLRGSYEETIFDKDANGSPIPNRMQRLAEGSVNSMPPGVLHQTINDHPAQPCVTLFVRGKSMLSENRVWDVNEQQFRLLAGRDAQLRNQLKAIADFVVGIDNQAGTVLGAFS